MSRETPKPVSGAADHHRECWDLLPWLVNGRLGDAERARLEAHLRDCAACREELDAQHRLRDHISREDRVAYAPAASFEKLWSRIEELEHEVPHRAAAGPDGRARSSRSPARMRAWTHPDTRLSRWLVAAVVVQALALGWLASTYVSSRPAAEWQYRTVTSSSPVSSARPRYRVIFASDASVAELQRVLATHGLVIVQGSSSDVFTVARGADHGSADDEAVLERLRNEPSIRFVELAKEAFTQ